MKITKFFRKNFKIGKILDTKIVYFIEIVIFNNHNFTILFYISEIQEAEKKAWTQDEQTRLEQALRTYGPKEPERWEKIQAAVPTRTKRECKIIWLIIPLKKSYFRHVEIQRAGGSC